ncbi:TPA: hypothetical protein EYP27_03990 [Candidatus Bathyarchaeota archaeon]|nr:hypothetical protein [Candidatus Bathyarchaeota archaeon]
MKYLYDDPCHVVIEIENKRCRVLKILETLGIRQFKIADIRGLSGGLTRHLVKLSPEQIDKIPKGMLVKMREGGKLEERAFVWVESEGCDVCNTILSHGSFLISGTSIQNSTLVYDFITPNFDAYTSILSALESSNLKVKVLKVMKLRSQGKILTEKQERVLWLALKTGLFDYPRKVDMVEFSRKLGISSSTISEVIRRGIRRLLEHHFEAL